MGLCDTQPHSWGAATSREAFSPRLSAIAQHFAPMLYSCLRCSPTTYGWTHDLGHEESLARAGVAQQDTLGV